MTTGSESYYNKGIMQFEKGQYDLSIENFKKAIEIDSSNFNYHYNLGLAYVRIEEYDLAIACFKKGIFLNPGDADLHHNLGIAYYNKNELNLAIESYKMAISIKSDDPASYDNIGIAYFSSNNFKEAVINFKKAFEISPNNPSFCYNLAYTYYVTEQYDLAKEFLLRTVNLNKNDEEAYFNLGNVYLKLNEINFAKESYNKVLLINPNHTQAKEALAGLHENAESIQVQENPIKTSDQQELHTSNINIDVENIFQAAMKLFKNKDFESSVKEFEKVLLIDKNHLQTLNALEITLKLIKDADKLYNTALSCFSNSKFSESIDYLQQALSIYPHSKKAKELISKALDKDSEVCESYVKSEQYDLAVNALKKSIAQNPNNPKTHFTLGNVYIKQKEYEFALESFKNTLKIDPDHKEAQEAIYNVIKIINTYNDESQDYIKLSLIYIQKHDYINALSSLIRVLKINPDNKQAKDLIYKISELYNKSTLNDSSLNKDLKKEIRKYEMQIQDNPKDFDAYYNLGIIYMQKEKHNLAIENLKNALNINPNYTEAQQALYSLLRVMNT